LSKSINYSTSINLSISIITNIEDIGIKEDNSKEISIELIHQIKYLKEQ